MKACAKPANLAKINWQKVKKEGSLGLSGKRNQLAFVLGACDLVDILQICRFPAQTRPIVDNLAIDFPRNVIYERQLSFLFS
jgi:hypothetical protein